MVVSSKDKMNEEVNDLLRIKIIFEEYEKLNALIGKFVKLSPEFPEEEVLAVQIGTPLGKLHGLISDLIEENRKLKKND